MSKKNTPLLSILIIPIIGFFSGFFATNTLIEIDPKSQVAQALNVIKNIEVPGVQENVNVNQMEIPKVEEVINVNQVEILQVEEEISLPASLDIFIQQEEIINTEEITKKNKPTFPFCPTSANEYEDMSLLNIGQDIGLPDISYTPKNLKELDFKFSFNKNICLIEEARDSFEAMAKEARTDNVIINAISGYRDYNTQEILFSESLKISKTDSSNSTAKPGHSEHQLGTAIDITRSSIDYTSVTDLFDETKEDLWLRENAHLFGFIQSYPKDKENITGYKYEPWHYRYVGIENAQNIKDREITITEFLKELN